MSVPQGLQGAEPPVVEELQKINATLAGLSSALSAVVAIPPTPDALTSVVQAAGNVMYGTFNIVSLPVLVPAGKTATLIILPPATYSVQVKRELVATCDSYSSLVQITSFTINGQEVLQVGFPYVIDAPKTFDSAVDLIVGMQGIVVRLSNPSLYDATVYFSAEALHITNEFVNTYLVPALDFAYRRTQQVTGGAVP